MPTTRPTRTKTSTAAKRIWSRGTSIAPSIWRSRGGRELGSRGCGDAQHGGESEEDQIDREARENDRAKQRQGSAQGSHRVCDELAVMPVTGLPVTDEALGSQSVTASAWRMARPWESESPTRAWDSVAADAPG